MHAKNNNNKKKHPVKQGKRLIKYKRREKAWKFGREAKEYLLEQDTSVLKK